MSSNAQATDDLRWVAALIYLGFLFDLKAVPVSELFTTEEQTE